MDDFKILIYILAAVAYFLFSQWRKAFKGGGEAEDEEYSEPRRPHPRQQPPKPVTSFEDILRELQPRMEQARQQGQEVVQEVNVPPAMPPLAEAAPKYKSYENITPKVLSWEKKAEAIEAAKKSKQRRQESFKAYEQETKPAVSRYAEILRNPTTARDAVILSEIFNRKYS